MVVEKFSTLGGRHRTLSQKGCSFFSTKASRCRATPRRCVQVQSRSRDDFNRSRGKENVKFWNEEQRFLRQKWKEQKMGKSFSLPGLLPILLGFGVASALGPLVLAFVFGFAGLAISAVMGFTALTVFLPVVLIGSLVTSVVFGALQLAFAVPILGAGFFAYKWARWSIKKSIQAEIPNKRQEFDQKEHGWQMNDREADRLTKQELFEFDKRLEKRTDPSSL